MSVLSRDRAIRGLKLFGYGIWPLFEEVRAGYGYIVFRTEFLQPAREEVDLFQSDGAKAYRNLASPLYDGRLLEYEGLRLGHTCVKHKPPTQSFPKSLKPEFGMARI